MKVPAIITKKYIRQRVDLARQQFDTCQCGHSRHHHNADIPSSFKCLGVNGTRIDGSQLLCDCGGFTTTPPAAEPGDPGQQ